MSFETKFEEKLQNVGKNHRLFKLVNNDAICMRLCKNNIDGKDYVYIVVALGNSEKAKNDIHEYIGRMLTSCESIVVPWYGYVTLIQD